MFPRMRFFLTPPILAVALLVSACSPEADPGELRDLLVENGLAETHIDISGPDAEGILWATYDMREDCELQLKWDGEEEVLVLRSEEHTSELQSRGHLVCRLLLEKQNASGRT